MFVHIVVIDVLGNVGKQLPTDLIGRPVKDDKVDRQIIFQQELADGVHRHPQRLILRIAVNPGGNQREGDGFAAMLPCQRKACPVAGGQLFPLSLFPVLPHRAHRMDHIFAGQTVGFRDLGLAGSASAKGFAFSQQLRPRRPVDAAIHAATAQKRLLGSIDNGVHGHFCNVVANDFQRHG